MSATESRTVNKQAQVKVWWEQVQIQLKPFFDVMAEGGRIHKDDMVAALNYLETRVVELAQSAYPQSVEEIRQQLLASVENLIHSLYYRRDGNNYQSQVRLDMAKMSLDALRFHLIQHNIMF